MCHSKRNEEYYTMKNEGSEKVSGHVGRRRMLEKAGLFVGASGAVAAFAKPAAAQQGNGVSGAVFLLTITDANSGAFSSRSVITFHSDGSVEVVDSGEGGPAFTFSSQLGVWINGKASGAIVRTLDFSFPSAGIARVDYNFVKLNAQDVSGTITLTGFGLQQDPQGGGGTLLGTFNFTGQRVTL
jgi:hypothetical protein